MGIWSDVYKILTLRCDESSQLLSAETDEQLKVAERIALRMHLLGCKACRRYRLQLRFMREFIMGFCNKILSGPTDLPPLDDAGKQRMIDALRGEMGKE